MDRFRFEFHNGKPIVELDYSSVACDGELAILMNQGTQFALEGEIRGRKSLRVLINLSSTHMSRGSLGKLKDSCDLLLPCIKKMAIVRVDFDSWTVFYFNLLGFLARRPTRQYRTREEGLKFLY
jgi:hypothetical protein